MKSYLSQMMARKAEELYCILIEKPDGLHLAKDPGLNKPYAMANKKVVEDTAKIIGKQTNCRTAVHTVADAWDILMRQSPDRKRLFETMIKKVQ